MPLGRTHRRPLRSWVLDLLVAASGVLALIAMGGAALMWTVLVAAGVIAAWLWTRRR